MTNLPPDYIDESIQGDDRKLLEIYYTAELSEGGSADEVILRGIKAVLAHPSQMVEIKHQGRVYRMPPGGKVVIGNATMTIRAGVGQYLVEQPMTTANNRPSLMRVMKKAWETTTPDYDGSYAAEIRALRDWLVPEEEPPHRGMRPGGSTLTYQETLSVERQRLRAMLTAEAERAERGE